MRVQAWLDDGEEISVVSVWPTADWHERGLGPMGIRWATPTCAGSSWTTTRKGTAAQDYPVDGEPVRYSEAE